MKYIWTVKFPSRGKTHAAGIHEKPWSYQQITERIGLRENDGTWKHETGNWELQVFGLRETPFFFMAKSIVSDEDFPTNPPPPDGLVRSATCWPSTWLPNPRPWGLGMHFTNSPYVCVYIYIYLNLLIYIYNSLYILYVCVYTNIHM